jgi:hypothetical protein
MLPVPTRATRSDPSCLRRLRGGELLLCFEPVPQFVAERAAALLPLFVSSLCDLRRATFLSVALSVLCVHRYILRRAGRHPFVPSAIVLCGIARQIEQELYPHIAAAAARE